MKSQKGHIQQEKINLGQKNLYDIFLYESNEFI
jgi:hypothetical protein